MVLTVESVSEKVQSCTGNGEQHTHETSMSTPTMSVNVLFECQVIAITAKAIQFKPPPCGGLHMPCRQVV